jgi:hypothetical protein
MFKFLFNCFTHNESGEENYGEAKPIELEEIWSNDRE